MNVDKLRNCFDEMVVYKDLKKSNFFNSLSLPSFMRDWILKKFEDEDGSFDTEKVAAFVKKYLPKKDDWNSIKNPPIGQKRQPARELPFLYALLIGRLYMYRYNHISADVQSKIEL